MNTKTIMQWVRQILGDHDTDIHELPAPGEETVRRLIEKSVETAAPTESEGNRQEPENEKENNTDNDENPAKCPYILKRNIVASLQEIRKFAEENHLAAAMVRALLTLLAEMALNALKGKVSGTALAILLNAMNFDKARTEAYREGEIAGRNAKIMEKHFPKTDDGLPHLNGTSTPTASHDIFNIARDCRADR